MFELGVPVLSSTQVSPAASDDEVERTTVQKQYQDRKAHLDQAKCNNNNNEYKESSTDTDDDNNDYNSHDHNQDDNSCDRSQATTSMPTTPESLPCSSSLVPTPKMTTIGIAVTNKPLLDSSSNSDNGSPANSLSPNTPNPHVLTPHGGHILTAISPLRVLRRASDLVFSLRDGMTASEREAQRRLAEEKRTLEARLKHVTTANEWETVARRLDTIEGNDRWRDEDDDEEESEDGGDSYDGVNDVNCCYYYPKLLAARLAELDEARTQGDIRRMMYLVRTALARDLAGMGHIDLYRHAYVGTKRLIERYVASAVATIETLVTQASAAPAEALPSGLAHKDLLDGLLSARQSFGRSALLLSGGATFGMAHIGVAKTLFEAKLLPRIISGASAGSIVCSCVCTRTDEEIPLLLKEFPWGDLAVFDDAEQEDGLADHVRRLLTAGTWCDVRHLTRVMRDLLGDITFQEAYNRTRRVCNICVSSASLYELPRLLNYITAPNIMIWSAVAASCSVPLVFSAAPLLVKDPDTGAHLPWDPTPQRWIDGSVDNDLPMSRLAEMFNVNHFIVSQVNPHVVPFLTIDDEPYSPEVAAAATAAAAAQNLTKPAKKRTKRTATTRNITTEARPLSSSASITSSSSLFSTVTTLAKDEALHRLHALAEARILPNLATKLCSILSQRYSGDINVIPQLSLQDFPRLLKNPTPDFMLRSCLAGERATWPKLSRIRDRCAIEMALDRACHALRTRVVFSRSQVDLRRLVTWRKSEIGFEFEGGIVPPHQLGGYHYHHDSSATRSSIDAPGAGNRGGKLVILRPSILRRSSHNNALSSLASTAGVYTPSSAAAALISLSSSTATCFSTPSSPRQRYIAAFEPCHFYHNTLNNWGGDNGGHDSTSDDIDTVIHNDDDNDDDSDLTDPEDRIELRLPNTSVSSSSSSSSSSLSSSLRPPRPTPPLLPIFSLLPPPPPSSTTTTALRHLRTSSSPSTTDPSPHQHPTEHRSRRRIAYRRSRPGVATAPSYYVDSGPTATQAAPPSTTTTEPDMPKPSMLRAARSQFNLRFGRVPLG